MAGLGLDAHVLWVEACKDMVAQGGRHVQGCNWQRNEWTTFGVGAGHRAESWVTDKVIYD